MASKIEDDFIMTEISIAGEIIMTTAVDIDTFVISTIIKLSTFFAMHETDFVHINMHYNISQISKIANLEKLFTIMTKDEFNEKDSNQQSPY